MQITISITSPERAIEQDLLTVDVGPEMTTADLKAVIQSDTNLPPASQHLYHNGQLLIDESKTLEELRIGEGDMLAMHVRSPATPGMARGAAPSQSRGYPQQAAQQGGNAAPGRRRRGPDPEMMRLRMLGDPRMLAEIRNSNPELANVVQDQRRFGEVWDQVQRQQEETELQKQREIAALNEDPFNLEAQAKIEEIIRQEAVMENLQNALEHNPEAFGKVHMLYIDVEVNGHKVKAFVDSGAQATIMSPSCAETCGIMRLVDRRFAGIARGVGTAKILGRVHSAQIKIGSLFLACSFTVMEGKDVDLLLGLDMLKRHQACIDLQKGSLVIRDVEVPFLGEADIPKNEEVLMDEPTVDGPAGTQVGARSGAVTQPGAASSPQPRNFQGQGKTLGQGSSSTSQAHTQTQTPSPSQRSQQAQPSAARSFPQADINQLMEMGFSRDEVIQALEMTGGNVELAAGLLL